MEKEPKILYIFNEHLNDYVFDILYASIKLKFLI